MSITIELSPQEEQSLRRQARERGTDVNSLATAFVRRGLGEKPAALPGGYVRPTKTPDWVKDLKPARPVAEGRHWSEFVIGKWPGPETEEELLAAEKRIDDEDAGRG